jgi:hypothetical protein
MKEPEGKGEATQSTGLGDRLADLPDRVHRGAYRAQPSRRVYIPKADGLFGGPAIQNGSDDQQRSPDSTCRKLHRSSKLDRPTAPTIPFYRTRKSTR